MKRAKYTCEFKEDAVKQVIDKRHQVPDVAQWLRVAEGVLYTLVKKFKKADEPVASGDVKAMQAEMAKLKAELRRTTEERDILKIVSRVLCQTVRVK
jgi:transposase